MARCRGCSTELTGVDPRRKWCSEACRIRTKRQDAEFRTAELEAQRIRERARYVPASHSGYVCTVCGEEYTAGHVKSRFCGRTCQRRYYRGSTDRQRREVVRQGERFTRYEIYERDGWICGLCGGDIDQSARFPAPDSPSIDHILAIALGGQHTRGNVQAAHWRCNHLKGAQVA